MRYDDSSRDSTLKGTASILSLSRFHWNKAPSREGITILLPNTCRNTESQLGFGPRSKLVEIKWKGKQKRFTNYLLYWYIFFNQPIKINKPMFALYENITNNETIFIGIIIFPLFQCHQDKPQNNTVLTKKDSIKKLFFWSDAVFFIPHGCLKLAPFFFLA